MRDFLDQVEAANRSDLFYVALATALLIPDMAASMDAEDGRTTGERYAAWFDQHAAPRFYGMITGDDCYGLRCSMLHQGRMTPHTGNYSRVLFIEPGVSTGVFMHCNVLNDALNIDVSTFVTDLVEAARLWLDHAEPTELYQRNFDLTMQRHPEGLSLYIGGVAVIG